MRTNLKCVESCLIGTADVNRLAGCNDEPFVNIGRRQQARLRWPHQCRRRVRKEKGWQPREPGGCRHGSSGKSNSQSRSCLSSNRFLMVAPLARRVW